MIQIDKPMPDGCDVCPLMYDYIQCNALPEGCKDDDAFNEEGFDWTKRPEWCPLKEQEAVVPKYNARTNWFECGNCHYSMTSGMHCRSELIPATKVRYCANCGFPVNWEGR